MHTAVRNTMNEPLKVFLVDDNPDDRALVERELRRVFPELIVEHVADAALLEKLLAQDSPHLVITDYQLRWTDGLTVLRKVKSRWPESAVIMFTGTGSEEVAVEAMKSGLEDYVLKSPKRYSSLPGAAKLALRIAEQRRAAHEAEQRYKTLFDTVPVGLYRTSPSGQMLDVNAALLEMLGYPREVLMSLNASDLYVNRQQYYDWQSQLERHGTVVNYEAHLKCHDGTQCWVKDTARVIRDATGHALFYEGSLEDITERKIAEEEREKLIVELQDALAKIKTLSGLLPICASCKKIRDDKGYWNQIEVYIETHSDAEFTHSFCPDCVKSLYPEVMEEAAEQHRHSGAKSHD